MAQRTGGRKPSAQADVCGLESVAYDSEGYRGKKAVKPAARRELVDYARHQHGASLRLACRAVGISDTVYRYQPDEGKDEPAIQALQKAVERYPAYEALQDLATQGTPLEP